MPVVGDSGIAIDGSVSADDRLAQFLDRMREQTGCALAFQMRHFVVAIAAGDFLTAESIAKLREPMTIESEEVEPAIEPERAS